MFPATAQIRLDVNVCIILIACTIGRTFREREIVNKKKKKY